MKKIILLLLVLLFIIPAASAVDMHIDYFYGKGCPACAKTAPVIDELAEKYPNVEFHEFEIYNNRSNLKILEEYYDEYGVSIDERYIPSAFSCGKYFIGYKPIKENLEDHILSEHDARAICPLKNNFNATGYVGTGFD